MPLLICLVHKVEQDGKVRTGRGGSILLQIPVLPVTRPIEGFIAVSAAAIFSILKENRPSSTG